MEKCIKDNNEPPTSNTQNIGSSLKTAPGKRKNGSWRVACVPSTDPFELEVAMIGFGLDLGVNIVDATEASVNAVQDALSRSCVSIANRSTHPRPWQVLIKLGVPPRRPSLKEPMHVDLARLKSILPAEVTIMPVVIELGGLSVAGNEISAGRNAACAVVASVTIRRPVSNSIPLLPTLTPLETDAAGRQALRQPTALLTPQLGFSSSMEVLARISEEVWRNNNQGGSLTPFANRLRNAVESDASAPFSSRSGAAASKDPPGDAADNNHQLVQPSYRDHSLEKESEMDRASRAQTGRSSLAFPIKLHDVLSEINRDGYGHIISWQHHGRSFKIHKKHEFVGMILPAYFRLLKMSSFLRQLRKHGFKRLSAGLDKGAYYHEQFLRGMRFLCHRMARITFIGSPADSGHEPNFYDMPPAPLEPPPSSERETEEITDTAITMGDSQANGKCRDQMPARSMSFSLKLHALLEKVEAEGRDDILCWLPHGRSFIIRDREALVDELIQKNFRLTKFSSFQRQLRLYNFQRIKSGRDKGAYYHEHFQRGKRELCQLMERAAITDMGFSASKFKKEPDLYSLGTPPC